MSWPRSAARPLDRGAVRRSSIRFKLAALIAGASCCTALLAAAAFVVDDVARDRDQTLHQLSAVARIIAGQAAPALMLNDPIAAGELLGSLRADTGIRSAVLYDALGACFALFNRAAAQGCKSGEELYAADDSEKTNDGPPLIRIYVQSGADRLGSLILVAEERTVASIISQCAGAALLILVFSLVVAAGLAVVLQTRLSEPILHIAKVARGVAETHQFQDRVAVRFHDEFGTLAESLNGLLDEIERRDGEVAAQHQRLEDQVVERSRAADELAIARDRAEEATRLKSQFLANMSHEIRTPINGITGMTELALGTDLTAEQRDYLDTIRISTDSLLAVVNEILDFSKIEAGCLTLASDDFDLRLLIARVLKPLAVRAAGKNLRTIVDISPQVPARVTGDAQRLSQVLTNLIGNAVKFTAEGEIAVRAEVMVEEDTQFGLHLSVRDTGIGIPEESQKRIFDPFVQADGSVTRRYGGTGLGLAICSQLVRAMGGDIRIESSPGKGSTFHVTLPLKKAAEPLPPLPAPVAVVDSFGAASALHILLVEDNAVNQKLARRMLEKAGHFVDVAGDGREALDALARGRFDLVLMDLQMPVMDGYQACREIRRRETARGGHLPVIALTAHAMASDREKCLKAGMDEFVAKPIRGAELLDKIRSVMALCHH